MMHGSIESNTANVRSAFNCALNDFLKMQSDAYNKMSAKGWYPTQTAEQTKIDRSAARYMRLLPILMQRVKKPF